MQIRSKPIVRPLIVLVGRTNVGKSTLFNRLTLRGQSLVSDIPATTRDVLFGSCQWQGRFATIVDTGGLSYPPIETAHFKHVRARERANDPFLPAIEQKVRSILKDADRICLVADASDGLVPADRQWTRFLKSLNKPLTLIVNKADRLSARYDSVEFTALGILDMFPVSGANGSGMGELLEYLLSQPSTSALEEKAPSIVIIGKPNVGKSTLYNALIGTDESIVSALPHTTRQPHRRRSLFDQWEVEITDTVGLRRRSKQEHRLERAGAQKTLSTIKSAHVALLVLDPFVEGISNQDQELARLLAEQKLASIIVVNKVDRQEANTHPSVLEQRIRRFFPHLSYAPIIPLSAQERKGISRLAKIIQQVYENFTKPIDRETLEVALRGLVLFPSAVAKKRPSRILLDAVRTSPPEFVLAQKKKQKTPIAILNRIETRLRERLDLLGTPIVIHVRRPLDSHRHER